MAREHKDVSEREEREREGGRALHDERSCTTVVFETARFSSGTTLSLRVPVSHKRAVDAELKKCTQHIVSTEYSLLDDEDRECNVCDVALVTG